MSIIDEVKDHFNEKQRIEEDLNSYHLMHSSQNIDPYEKPREDFIYSLILEYYQKGHILDVGCGIGNLVKRLITNKLNAKGIDLCEQMIKTAQMLLKTGGHSPDHVQCVDIFKYQCRDCYELIIANGVIWYYQEKLTFLEQLNKILTKSGKVIIVHRNDLFNLFAMNAGTVDFIQNRLFADRTLIDKEKIQTKLIENYPNLSSPVSVNSNLKKEFDNPLNIAPLYKEAGFEVIAIYYTYIHPFPPRWIEKTTSIDDYFELQMQYGKQWQGAFLGSQFIVVAQKL